MRGEGNFSLFLEKELVSLAQAVKYSVSKPLQSQINNKNTQYQTSEAHQNAQKWQSATINDLAKKYGFDYSQEYANRQAEAQAQAKRNAYNATKRENQTANKQTLRMVDSNVREANSGLDHSYFQQFINNQQQLSDRGLNAGLTQDSQMRLGMNKQSELASMYRDANNIRSKEMDRYNNEATRISEALALVEQEKIAQAQSLYQTLRQQGYQNLNTERDWTQQLDQSVWSRTQSEIERMLSTDKDAWQRRMEEEKFEYQKQQDALQLAAQQAAARAAASRRSSSSSSSGGGGGATTQSKSKVSQAYDQYKNLKAKGGSTAEDRYYSSLNNSARYPDQAKLAKDTTLLPSFKTAFTIPAYNPTQSRLVDMLNGTSYLQR